MFRYYMWAPDRCTGGPVRRHLAGVLVNLSRLPAAVGVGIQVFGFVTANAWVWAWHSAGRACVALGLALLDLSKDLAGVRVEVDNNE